MAHRNILHGCIADDGNAHVETVDELKSLLQDYSRKHPARLAIILQTRIT
jgi:hypothetical protein